MFFSQNLEKQKQKQNQNQPFASKLLFKLRLRSPKLRFSFKNWLSILQVCVKLDAFSGNFAGILPENVPESDALDIFSGENKLNPLVQYKYTNTTRLVLAH